MLLNKAAMPPNRRRTRRFKRRGSRRFRVKILLAVVLLVGSAYVIENWLGARALARVKAEVAAAGIELDPHKITSFHPPDAENFCATPLLLAFGSGATSGPELHYIARIARWQDVENSWDYPDAISPALQSPNQPEPTDWAAIRDAILRINPRFGLVRGGTDPLGELAAMMDRDFDRVMADLEAALPRPYSVLVPTSLDRLRDSLNPSSISLSDVGVPQLSWVVNLRAHLDLGTGRQKRAVENIRILLRLAEGSEDFDNGIHTWAARSSGYARLLALKTTWTTANYPCEIPRQAWLELAAAHRTGTSLERVSQQVVGAMIHAGQLTKGFRASVRETRSQSRWDSNPFVLGWIFEAMPSGWYDFNTAHALEAGLISLRHADDPANPQRFDSQKNEIRVKEWLTDRSWLGHTLLARIVATGDSWSLTSVARSVIFSRLAEIACALEAFHADHHSYPDDLERLVPEYLPSVPDDIDGKPIRYSPDPENGRYRLWSVGEDGIDNGGVEEVKPRRQRTKPRYWFGRTDDWVWQYPPR